MLGFCEGCRDYVEYSIVEERMGKNIKGNKVYYRAEKAICNECDKEIFIGEVRDRNLKRLEKAFDEYWDFKPKIAILPGETIKENMEYLKIDEKELAIRLDFDVDYLSCVLEGSKAITETLAIKLERVIGPSKDFWLNLEKEYQSNKRRLK